MRDSRRRFAISFNEGKTEVVVKICGIREPAAFAAAKRFAARALGGSASTRYRYAQTGNSVIADSYNAPGILGPLEAFCGCHADAAKEARLSSRDLDLGSCFRRIQCLYAPCARA